MLVDTRKSLFAKLHALPLSRISWTKGFWADAVNICRKKTIAHLQEMFESAEFSYVLENFRICANENDHRSPNGTSFGDGDFYKWIEAAVYIAIKYDDRNMLCQLDDYINLIAKVQKSDGYIYTKQIIKEKNGIKYRKIGVKNFEAYNMGHLITAGCLYYRLTDKELFLNIAKKAADYLEKAYGSAIDQNSVETTVCPSHYMGLIELYRTTEDERYLRLAHTAIEVRDSVKNGTDDNQDRLKLKSHKKIVGHAVRATYLYAGVADLYAEEGDKEYLEMLHQVWENMVNTKMYITGGLGALYNGASPYGYFFKHALVHQAFGYEYQLPNVTAYSETCASVGLVMWAYRMFLIEPRVEYMDVLERAMLNVNLAAVSLEGDCFFYENVLRRTKKLDYRLAWRLRRAKYISSFCCPPNVARVISQSIEYAYAISDNSIYFGLYGSSEMQVDIKDTEFTLVQDTEYPYDGKIVIFGKDVRKNGVCKLMIRIPGWVENGYIKISGKTISLSKENSCSYMSIMMIPDRDIIEIQFDMPVRYTTAHPLVEECVNQAAVERGPLVYCIETQDAEIESLDNLLLDLNTKWKITDYYIKGRKVVALEGNMLHNANKREGKLYETLQRKKLEPVQVRMIPYFAWDNRGIQDDGNYDVKKISDKLDTPDDMFYEEMRVWLPIAY